MGVSRGEKTDELRTMAAAQGAAILWEWRRYRNEAMWASVYRWGGASLAIAIAPYVIPSVIGSLGYAVLVFPVVAFLLSSFAAYLIAVQYRLYKQVDGKFRAVLNEYAPGDLPDYRLVHKLLTISFGRILPGAFMGFAVVVQLGSALVLFHLAATR